MAQGVCDERSVHGAGAGAGAAAGRQSGTRRESLHASTGLIDRGGMDHVKTLLTLPCFRTEPCPRAGYRRRGGALRPGAGECQARDGAGHVPTARGQGTRRVTEDSLLSWNNEHDGFET